MSESPRLRLAVVGIVVVSLFSALFARLWYLQVLDTKSFVTAATTNQIRLVYEDAPRGRILDRNGNVLVDNRRTQAITVNRNELAKLKNADDVKGRLSALLNISREDLDKRIANVRYSQYKPIPVAEGDAVPEDLYIYIKEHQDDFPSVEATIVSERAYPNQPPTLAAHLLGYVGDINEEQLKTRKQDGYRLGDSLGKSGAEFQFESKLRGQKGVTKLQVNSAGQVVRGVPLAVKDPVPGQDVTLTIDLNVQRLAEESLVQGLEAARGTIDKNGDGRHFEAPAGSVVVTDPRDGSIIAMASYPTYNPEEFVGGIDPTLFSALNDKANYEPFNNRATLGYSPGSTFKLVTSVAAVQTGTIPGNFSITDSGVFKANCNKNYQGKCTFRNSGGKAWGRVDLRRALTVSSDVYFYGLGEKLNQPAGDGPLQKTAHAFGFDPVPGARNFSDGVIPSPEWKKQLCERIKCANREDEWRAGDSINMAIGQGNVLVTPLQLANAYATFGNGGTLYQPRLSVDEAPKVIRNLELTPAIRQPILEGLKGAIARDEGTAFYAFAGYPSGILPVAGKTGTAQVTKKHDTAVFAAFAPADDPQYAISVVMEQSGFGGSAAAPVARRIFEGIAGQPPAPIRLGTGSD